MSSNELRIAHVADLHLRGLTRHDEIRTTALDFHQQCLDNQVQHIVIAGDVFHTKCQGISAEYIDLLSWMLRLWASAGATLHIILGNHDFAQTNLSRQDAVSPIVNALADKRIKLYKQSGVYPIEKGVNLCVFSLWDEEHYIDVKPVDGELNIAVFHGGVWGAVTEIGWELEGEMRVHDFEKFDFCLLGDIHKHQFLDTRRLEMVIDEAELVNYPNAEVVEVLS